MYISSQNCVEFWSFLMIFYFNPIRKNELKNINIFMLKNFSTFNMAPSILLFSFGKTSNISGLKLSV